MRLTTDHRHHCQNGSGAILNYSKHSGPSSDSHSLEYRPQNPRRRLWWCVYSPDRLIAHTWGMRFNQILTSNSVSGNSVTVEYA